MWELWTNTQTYLHLESKWKNHGIDESINMMKFFPAGSNQIYAKKLVCIKLLWNKNYTVNWWHTVTHASLAFAAQTLFGVSRFIISSLCHIYRLCFPPIQNWKSGPNHKNCIRSVTFSAYKLMENKFKTKFSENLFLLLKSVQWCTLFLHYALQKKWVYSQV